MVRCQEKDSGKQHQNLVTAHVATANVLEDEDLFIKEM
jgi:hypothetical protein